MPIYDQSYAHWKGRFEGRVFRWMPITANGIRLVFRRKLMILLLVATLVPFVIRAGMIVLIHYSESLFNERPPDEVVALFTANGTFYFNFLFMNQVFGVIAICLFMGAPLVARDLKAGALEVYFSKPLLLSDYLAGKFMTIAFFLACITLFPALILFLLDWFLAGSAFWSYLPGILASSALIITVCSLVVLAASSLARTARTAAIAWFGFHMALFVISRISTAIFRDSNLELIDIPTSLGYVAKMLFGCPLTHSWHWSVPVGYLLLISWGSLLVLLRRVKGVEVIDS